MRAINVCVRAYVCVYVYACVRACRRMLTFVLGRAHVFEVAHACVPALNDQLQRLCHVMHEDIYHSRTRSDTGSVILPLFAHAHTQSGDQHDPFAELHMKTFFTSAQM